MKTLLATKRGIVAVSLLAGLLLLACPGRARAEWEAGGPLAIDLAWTAEGNQASANFGHSVASAGDVNGDGYADVIVAADWYDNGQINEGMASLYLGSASGLAASPIWTAEGGVSYDYFGNCVASAGDVNGDGYGDVIVGVSHYQNGQTAEGRAVVYLGSVWGLDASPAWACEGNVGGAAFGYAVASAGDVNGDGYDDVIVGSPDYSWEGWAFLYLGSASGLATQSAWAATDHADARFGCAVSTAGDVNGDGYADVIVGADWDSYDPIGGGQVYLYLGDANGLSASYAWTAQSDQVGARLGQSVASAGDVNGDGYGDVIVGARRYTQGQSNEGKAFLFLGSAYGLAEDPAWTAEGDQEWAGFGASVASAGDMNDDGYSDVIVGAESYSNGEAYEGSAFLDLGSAPGLSENPCWIADGDQANSYFGCSVASAGDVNGDACGDLIIGAEWYDNGQTNEGMAFVFHGRGDMPTPTPPAPTTPTPAPPLPDWSVAGGQLYAELGESVATAGDVNGDGYGDIVIGAPFASSGQADEGFAYLYLGLAEGLPENPAWIGEGNQVDMYYGWSVASAGDVNNDGYGDVIVGAPADLGWTPEGIGKASVYLGSVSGLAATAVWTEEAEQAGSLFGICVASAGDVNGDGYGDVIVGASHYGDNRGRAHLYMASASGLPASPDWTGEGDVAGACFGDSVSRAGDVNGDGYGDIIIGAWGDRYGGKAFLYLGSASGLAANPAWVAGCGQEGAHFGSSVASAGDVNGDGYDDVIIGASWYENHLPRQGRALVYSGSASGLSESAVWTADGMQDYAYFGFSVASAGDFDGNGFGDVIVGAIEYTNGELWEGGAFVYLGSHSGPSRNPDWILEGNQAMAGFGTCVASAGDVNHDRYGDLIIGAPHFDGGYSGEGKAFVYFGRGDLQSTPTPRPTRTPTPTPVPSPTMVMVGVSMDLPVAGDLVPSGLSGLPDPAGGEFLVDFSGVLRTWRVKLGQDYPVGAVRLQVLRSHPEDDRTCLCIAEDTRSGPLAAGVNAFSILIPVQAGDRLGFYASDEIMNTTVISGFRHELSGVHEVGEVRRYESTLDSQVDLVNADLKIIEYDPTPTPVPWPTSSATPFASPTAVTVGASMDWNVSDEPRPGDWSTISRYHANEDLYACPFNGMLVTWRVKLREECQGNEVRLQVLRPDPVEPGRYLCVADDVRSGSLAAGVSVFSIVIPVQAGDLLGFYASDAIQCRRDASGSPQDCAAWRQGAHGVGEEQDYATIENVDLDLINADLQLAEFVYTPTPVPPPNTLGCGWEFEDPDLEAGEEFHLVMRGWNTTGEAKSVLQCAVLEVGDTFFFGSRPEGAWDPSWPWPSWSESLAFTRRVLQPGESFVDTVLRFDWPEGAGFGAGTFYGGLLDAADGSILGEIECVDFTFR